MTLAPMYLAESAAELWLVVPGFDDLLLTGVSVDDGGHQFQLKAQAEEATWDNPVPVDVAVSRWMADGAVATTQGHDNRSPYFKVIVSAGNAVDLAAGEAALALRSNQPGLLVWYPPSGPDEAPASVFEVWTWHLEHTFDVDRENRLARMYGVRATAKPWVRSLDQTIVDALAAVTTPTVTTVDACSSLTGWTGAPNAPTLSSGKVVESNTATLFSYHGGAFSASLTRTGTVSSPPAYLGIDATVNAGGTVTQVTIDGTPLTLAGIDGSVSWWNIPAGTASFTTLTITGTRQVPGAGTYTVTVSVDEVKTSDSLGGIGSHKQLYRTIDVGGSVPTSGSIHIDGTSPLGTVLVYTCPDDGSGYIPALRPYRVSGNTVTPDATAVSGAFEALVTAGTPLPLIDYKVPSNLLREASYAVLARVKTVDFTSTLTAQVLVENGDVHQFVTGTPINTQGTNIGWVVLGIVSIPTQPLPAESTRRIDISLTGTAPSTGGQDLSVDEVYLFDITHGALSLIQTNYLTQTQVWLDAADADPVRNRPAVYSGTVDDRTDAAAVGSDDPSPTHGVVLALGDHDLAAGGSVLFTVTDLLNDAAASVSFYRRWHTHAGT